MRCASGQNKNKVLFILRSSKTHNRGDPPKLIKITSTATIRPVTNDIGIQHHCPYQLLWSYLHFRKGYLNDDENFFVFRDRTPVSPRNFTTVLKKVITFEGLDCKNYSSHSMRVWRSLDLLKLGLSVETIKKLGRWKSNAVYAYLRF